MKINLSFEYNTKTEIEQIAHTCLEITEGIFQNNRHLLLERYYPGYGWLVYLPILDFSLIPDYWNKIAKLSSNPRKNDTSDSLILKEMGIFELELLSEEQVQVFKEDLQEHLPELEVELSKVYDNLDIQKIDIVIRPTMYGQQRTFSKAVMSGEILTIDLLYLRIDTNFSDLVSMIVSSIVMYTLDKPWNDAEWGSKHNIAKYILHNTSLSSLEKKYTKTYKTTREENVDWEELWSQSNEYFRKLGYPVKSKISVDSNGSIYMNKQILKDFSKTEIKILKYFIRNKNRLISYETLGDIIWNNDTDKYSLWAVTKHMQRIRGKLNILDRKAELISTIKGKGYILYD